MDIKFLVTGMTCAACAARVEKVAQKTPDVEKAEVNLLAGTLQVQAKTDVSQQIINAITDAGYGASAFAAPHKAPNIKEDSQKQMKTRILISSAFLVVIMYFTMGHMIELPLP